MAAKGPKAVDSTVERRGLTLGDESLSVAFPKLSSRFRRQAKTGTPLRRGLGWRRRSAPTGRRVRGSRSLASRPNLG